MRVQLSESLGVGRLIELEMRLPGDSPDVVAGAVVDLRKLLDDAGNRVTRFAAVVGQRPVVVEVIVDTPRVDSW